MNNSYSKIIFILLLGIFSSTPIVAQELSYKQFTEEDGLPSLNTYEIVQDSSGILWIGTENGLVSYDGDKFEKYQFPEFQDNDILQTFIHETGDVGFVNLANEIGLIIGEDVSKFTTNVNLGGFINLYSFRGRNFFTYIVRNQFFFTKIGGFLVLENGLIKNDTSVFKYNSSYDFSHNINHYLDINNTIIKTPIKYDIEFDFVDDAFKDERNNITSRYERSHTNKGSYLKNDHGVANNVTNEFIEIIKTDNMSFFMKKQNYYVYIINNEIFVYDVIRETEKLISDDYIYQYAFEDKEGILWASTQNNGIVKFNNFETSFEIIDSYEKEVVAINKSNKSFLVTTYNEGIIYDSFYFIKDEIKFKNPRKSISKNTEEGYLIFNGPDKITTSKHSFDSPYRFLTINTKEFIEIEGYLYLGTSRGLISNYRENFNYNNHNGHLNHDIIELPDKRITQLLLSSTNKNLYVGTTKGLFLKRNLGEPIVFCEALSNEIVSAIKEANDSILYVGTENHGLYKLTNGKITDTVNINKGLLSNSINDISINGKNIVLATSNGLSLYDVSKEEIHNLSTFHGLSSKKTSAVIFNKGNILAGVGKNLMKVKISDFHTNQSLSTLTIDKILVNNEEINWGDNNNFRYNHNKIEFLFNHVSMRSSESEKRLKYRIKSIDDKWEIVKEPLIRLPALAPGDYVVEAKGINEIGEESELLELSFIIKPPWWQTTIARLLGLISMFMLFYFFYRNRMNQLKKEEEVKRVYLTQINEVKDQALQLQMNPHFIFNSLNAIQNFIGNNEERNAINYLARFARLIRLIFEFSKSSKITLEEEIEFVELYINLEKLRFKDRIHVEFFVSEDVRDNQDVLTIPPLLIQPIIENSFKHGLFHKVGVGHLWIKYELETDVLVITIQDDGIGRKASQARNISKEHNSSGLITTKERLDILNFGKGEDFNSILIEDLVDKNNNALGTKTVIKLNIQ